MGIGMALIGKRRINATPQNNQVMPYVSMKYFAHDGILMNFIAPLLRFSA